MKGMSLIVKRITRYTVGLIMLFGIYIVLHGHLTPGGGFAGGVIIALSFIHLVLAFGREEAKKSVPEEKMYLGESLGGLMFLGIALFGLLNGIFFLNFFSSKGQAFHLLSAGIIPLCNIAIGIKVGCGLFAVFMVLSLFRLAKKGEKK
jgi:multicomponent Na+:H+ antiporter subunit B